MSEFFFPFEDRSARELTTPALEQLQDFISYANLKRKDNRRTISRRLIRTPQFTMLVRCLPKDFVHELPNGVQATLGVISCLDMDGIDIHDVRHVPETIAFLQAAHLLHPWGATAIDTGESFVPSHVDSAKNGQLVKWCIDEKWIPLPTRSGLNPPSARVFYKIRYDNSSQVQKPIFVR